MPLMSKYIKNPSTLLSIEVWVIPKRHPRFPRWTLACPLRSSRQSTNQGILSCGRASAQRHQGTPDAPGRSLSLKLPRGERSRNLRTTALQWTDRPGPAPREVGAQSLHWAPIRRHSGPRPPHLGCAAPEQHRVLLLGDTATTPFSRHCHGEGNAGRAAWAVCL